MKKRAYLVVLAAVVALMVASGASAKKQYMHSNAKQAVHASKKADQRAAKHTLRRYGKHF